MTGHEVRPLAESEFREAHDLFRRALLWRPSKDEEWEGNSGRYEPGRVLGAFVDGALAGTAMATTNVVTVPGGRRLPVGAVTGVGVRADQTRRGLLTSLMREQLEDARRRGEAVAMLHASEAVIYERYGYGVVSRSRTVELDRRRAALRTGAPIGGRVRVLDPAEAAPILPAIYQRCAQDRPGQIGRDDAWWAGQRSWLGDGVLTAVHTDGDGLDDGFALYEAKNADGVSTLQVYDLKSASATAAVQLWRFLLGVDLVDRVVGHHRPLDEPLEWWLTDRRECRVTSVDDDLWLRLVDVLEALRARTFGPADPLVIEVRDEFLPHNDGGYRVGPDGVDRCSDQPQLVLDVAALAALYLGDQKASGLVAAGRIEARDPAAVAAADRLFAAAETPWCGTNF
ncbi:GNAT family N-acetyltransferase [Saccharopolyspora sp. NPDC003752]